MHNCFINVCAKYYYSSLLIFSSFTYQHTFVLGSSLVAQTVKHLPTVRETWVRSLGREDPLEKKMSTHPSTLAWKIPWTEEPGRLQSTGLQRVRHDWMTLLSHSIFPRRVSGGRNCAYTSLHCRTYFWNMLVTIIIIFEWMSDAFLCVQ